MKATIHKSHKTMLLVVKDLSTGDITVEVPDELTNEDLEDFKGIMREIFKYIAREDWRLNHDN